MNGITNLHGINKKHEETNYCAFDDNWKLKATKGCIQFYFYLRRLKNFQDDDCQTSNLFVDSSDQKIEYCAESKKVWSFLDLHRYCLLFYFVNSWTKTVAYLSWNSSWSEKYNEGRRTNWLSYWLVDELQDCDSQFIRRLVEVLRLVIHTARKF